MNKVSVLAEKGFPKDIHVLISGIHNYYLIWKRVFADVIEDLKIGKLSWIIQGGSTTCDHKI